MTFAAAAPAWFDERLALVLFALLLIAAAAPLILAWLTLLPPERDPFAARSDPRPKHQRDGFAIFLLANVTISLLLRLPGLPVAALISKLAMLVPADSADPAVMITFIWFGFIPGLAAAYCAVRANPMRWQLLAAGVLTLAFWFAGPWLLEVITHAA